MLLEFGLALALLAASLAAAKWILHLDERVVIQAEQLERTAAVQAEAMRMQQANERLAEWQAVTEETIDGGAEAVRAVHMGIAAIPFSIFESIPATRETSRLLRSVHDVASDSVYSAISTVNRLVGETSRARLQPTKPKSPQVPPSE